MIFCNQTVSFVLKVIILTVSLHVYSSEIFKSNFSNPVTPKENLKNPQTNIKSNLSDQRYSSHGNSNWSKVVKVKNNSVLRLKVGSGKYQDAIIATQSTELGFSNSPKGIRYKIELGSNNFGSTKHGNGTAQICIIGKNQNGKIPTSWWSAENAVLLKFNANWIGLSIKNSAKTKSNKASASLWSTNYKGNIKSIELLLSEDAFAVAINGIKSRWNTKGAQSGPLNILKQTAFQKGRITIGLKQQNIPVKPFYVDIKSIAVCTVTP